MEEKKDRGLLEELVEDTFTETVALFRRAQDAKEKYLNSMKQKIFIAEEAIAVGQYAVADETGKLKLVRHDSDLWNVGDIRARTFTGKEWVDVGTIQDWAALSNLNVLSNGELDVLKVRAELEVLHLVEAWVDQNREFSGHSRAEYCVNLVSLENFLSSLKRQKGLKL